MMASSLPEGHRNATPSLNRSNSRTLEERQKTIWEEMHDQMERRKAEWDVEVADLKKDFFRLKPEQAESTGKSRVGLGTGETNFDKANLSRMIYDTDDGGGKVFRVCFDVNNFAPEEVKVRAADGQILVFARHEEKQNGKTSSREFSRKVDVPPGVDVTTLRSSLNKSGVLQVEADVTSAVDDVNCQSARMSSPSQPPIGRSLSSEAGATAQQQQQAVMFVDPQDGVRKFKVTVEIGTEFYPEDLQVKTVDRKLIVHARHEERSRGKTSCKEFNREFDLPNAVDSNKIVANMTAAGCLVIEAPLQEATN